MGEERAGEQPHAENWHNKAAQVVPEDWREGQQSSVEVTFE